jgi:hypothetical protein
MIIALLLAVAGQVKDEPVAAKATPPMPAASAKVEAKKSARKVHAKALASSKGFQTPTLQGFQTPTLRVGASRHPHSE